MRTRYAPTPSGYLHIGNAAHLVLVEQLAREHDALIHLRIDDADQDRFRWEYLEDTFGLLDWLGLSWDFGPRSLDDAAAWTQETRREHYRRAWTSLVESGDAYACSCSRASWLGYAGDECPGGCRSVCAREVRGRTSWRVHIAGVRDPVIWRRDDVPAYHLTSVIDDDLFGIDLVIRGEDLRESTEVQRHVSALLPDSRFQVAKVLHHPLALDASGAKLSKSAGARARPLPRTERTREQILHLASEFRQAITPDLPRSLGN